MILSRKIGLPKYAVFVSRHLTSSTGYIELLRHYVNQQIDKTYELSTVQLVCVNMNKVVFI